MRVETADTINRDVASDEYQSIDAAADLIRTIDSAFSEITTGALTAANEADEARKNSRIASEIARLFSQQPVEQSGPTLFDRIPAYSGSISECKDGDIQDMNNFSKPTPPPPPPQSTMFRDGMSLQIVEVVPSMKEYDNKMSGSISVDIHCGTAPLRRRQHDTSASERLARAHSEDVISLTLELDKAKRSLEAEQMSHDETKSALRKASTKNEQLEFQIEKMLNDMETERENDARKVDQLEEDLRRAQFRVSAAEEDAQVALDLAKENAESREQLETWLQKSLQEIQILREHIENIDKPRSAEDGDPDDSKNDNDDNFRKPWIADDIFSAMHHSSGTSRSTKFSSSRPSKNMMDAGESVSQKMNWDDFNPGNQSTVGESIDEIANASRQLRNRLNSLGVSRQSKTKSSTVSGSTILAVCDPTIQQVRHSVDVMRICRNTTDILKKSGRKLNLVGRWWTGDVTTQLNEIHLESLAQHFCTAVEFELDQKHKEIQGLESLCAVWEGGVASKRSN